MELRQLRHFIAVAEELHFGRAAARLGAAQPSVSRGVIELERELGTKLLERTTRGVRLTHAGMAFLPEARQVLELADGAVEAARSARTEQPRLRIGFTDYSSDSVLPAAIESTTTRHPGLQVELHQRFSVADLMLERLDAAWMYTRRAEHESNLAFEPLVDFRFDVLLPATHPLADMSVIPFARLKDETIWTIERSTDPYYYDDIVSWCRQAGFEPTISSHHLMSRSTTANLITSAGGVILGHWRNWPENTIPRPLRNPTPTFSYALAWRSDRLTPELETLIETVRKLRNRRPTARRRSSVASGAHPAH
jgi:DNA-binding transcriptional LysR family regulator